MTVVQRLGLVCLLVSVFAGVRLHAFTDPREAFVAAWEETCVDGIWVDQDEDWPGHEQPDWHIYCSCFDGSCMGGANDFCAEMESLSQNYCVTEFEGLCWSDQSECNIDSGNQGYDYFGHCRHICS